MELILEEEEAEELTETVCTPVCVALVVVALLIAVVGRAFGLAGPPQLVALTLSGAATICLVVLGVLLIGLPSREVSDAAAEGQREARLDRADGALIAAVALTAIAAFVVLSTNSVVLGG